VAIGTDPLYTMELTDSEGEVSFVLTGADLFLEGTGEISGTTMTLSADIEGFAEFETIAEFTDVGNLENWITLEVGHRTRRGPGSRGDRRVVGSQ
jgi:hypothetical protein